MTTTYNLLENVDAENPDLLVAYREDLLVHDAASVEGYDGPFIWAIREYGTHFLGRAPEKQNWKNTAAAYSSIADGHLWGEERAIFFFFDGKRLIELTEERGEALGKRVFELATKKLGWDS